MNYLKFFCLNSFKNKITYLIFKFNIILFILFFFFVYLFFFLIFLNFFLYKKKFKKSNFFFKKNYYEMILFLFILFLILNISIYSTLVLLKIKKSKKFYSTVKIIGYQWKWYYFYTFKSGKNLNYFSNISSNVFSVLNFLKKKKKYILEVDKKLLLPIKKYIRLVFTSNDVIHSWYLPDLIVKQDVLPGYVKVFYTIFSKKGNYRGFCTELCGKNHSYMPIVVKAVSLLNYKKWIISNLFEKLINVKF